MWKGTVSLTAKRCGKDISRVDAFFPAKNPKQIGSKGGVDDTSSGLEARVGTDACS
jgi:hypothetical protein